MSKTIPPTCTEPQTGPKYWRGLDELAETPEFKSWVEREFPAGASELSDPVTRRNFVKIMSASFLLAGVGLGASGCRRPEEKILPFSRLPEGYVHGVAQFFATAFPTRHGAIPLLAKSNDGRPTKVEGNSGHPDSNGGTDRFAQASILNLYDPDRAIRYTKGGTVATKAAALDQLTALSQQAEANQGAGLCFLVERSSSPSRARLQKLIQTKFPQARWFVYEPVDFDIHRNAASIAAGQPVTPYFKLDKAKRILSLDCDFIGAEEDNHRFIRDFAKGRKIEGHASKKDEELINRLYVVESLMSLTGANADHRLRVPSSQVLQVAAALAAEIVKQGNAEFANLAVQVGKPAGVDAKWISECAKDLIAHAGKAVVVAGYRQPLAVHLLADAINYALGSIGHTVVFQPDTSVGAGTLAELATALNAGQVESLVILGGNPAYNAPVELDWAKLQSKAKSVVRLGYYEDETFAATTRATDWHLPLAHYLESWGDVRSSDGTLVSIQPLIAPLFDGLTELEVLARLAGLVATSPYEIVRETFRGLSAGWGFEESWNRFLHDGFYAVKKTDVVVAALNWAGINKELGAVKPVPAPGKDSLEVIFHRDYRVDDGRYNNNGWLQELPDPITKIVWENVFLLSQKTWEAFGFTQKDNESGNAYVPWVKLTLNGRSVEGPAWLAPGQADNTVGVALGYGRTKSGRVGNGAGFNAYALRTADAPYIAAGGKLSATGDKPYPVATTQSHWAMEGRPVVREANVAQYAERPDFAKGMNMPEPPGGDQPLYPNPLDVPDRNGVKPRDKSPHAWGMSIDLNSCVGCSSCMVACQAENNVPIVGKDQVGRSREMHWLRIDRYFTGSVENPQVVTQPMLCQHCESAPCESVCPVNATVHDEEGLNVMAYNRCVGTRYCSNNCPYKVRRFNYLDYNKRPLDKLKGPFFSTPLLNTVDGEWELARWWRDPARGIRPNDEWELLKLAKNPDVTVRMRGIMEKCTFCIQRIEGAKIAQKVKAGASADVEVPDGTFTTACAQACPAEAIVFGNVKDPHSRVSKLKAQERDYSVLEFLLTKPRTTYLARVRNPNPQMPDYTKAPASFEEWEKKGNHLVHHGHHDAAPHHAAEKGAH